MPVTEQTPVVTYNGNGVTTVFAYNFKILAAGDMEVTVDGVVKTLTTHYSVSGVGSEGGGNVTMVTAPASGTANIVLRRDMAYNRTTDYQDNGDLMAVTADEDADRPIMMIQQLVADLLRAIKLPVGTTANQVVGSAAARASQLLGFDSNGNLLTYAPANLSLQAVSTFIATLLDDANAAAARATLGAVGEGFLQSGTGAVSRTYQNKLRDVVSVKDFGATLDGVTDDTAAFDAAIVAAGTAGRLFIPAGTMYLPAGVSISAVDGLIIEGAGQEITKIVLGAGAGSLLTLSNANWFGMRNLTLEGDNATSQKAIVLSTVTRSIFENLMIRRFCNHAVDISGVASLVNLFNNVHVAPGGTLVAGARAFKITGGNAVTIRSCYLNGYATLIENTSDSLTSEGNTFEAATTGINSTSDFVSLHDKFYTISGARYVIGANINATIISPRNCTLAQIDHSAVTDKKWLHFMLEGQAGPFLASGSYTNGDTTPSVLGVGTMEIANSVPTTITNLDDGAIGQRVTLLFRDGNTTFDRTNAFLEGGVNFVSTAQDVLVVVKGADGSWRECSRSANS